MEIVGDRWTLLIVRDAALVRITRFADFHRRLGVAKDVLAERLARLVDEGILERRRYQARPVRHEYLITPKGSELVALLVAMLEWGDRYYAPRGAPRRLLHEACQHAVTQQPTCTHCGTVVGLDEVSTRPGPGAIEPQAA
jgi:DNA-binding HxlR family transcriptional regulator